MDIFFTIIGIIIVVATVIYLAWKYEKKRTESWALIAKDIGFEFQEKNTSIVHAHSHFKSFSAGRSRKAKNILQGKNGNIGITVMDYQYTTGSGKNSNTHSYTMCIFSKEGLKLPSCYLRMQVSFLDFFGKMFGGQDINFDEDEQFSKAFVLQGNEEESVREIFTEKVRLGFLDYKGQNFTFEGKDNQILIYRQKRIKPDDVLEMLQDAYKIIDLFEIQ